MKTQTMNKTYLFEEMPVKRAVLKQIIPTIFSQMIVLIYNLADTYFVGMLNDPLQMAAVTISSSAFLMLSAVANLFSVGGASYVARTLGQRNEKGAKQITSICFWCGILITAVYSMTVWIFASPILRLCGASDETWNFTFRYAKWVIVYGGVGTTLNVILADLFRSEGNANIASFGICMGGILNILFDPFFVLPQFLNLGVEGAGMATALTNWIATIFFIVYALLKRKSSVVHLNPKSLKYTGRHIKGILSAGIPASVQYALTVVSVAALSKFVSLYTPEAVAALGIVKKLDQLPLYFSIGVSNGILPLLAYNHASGNHKRRHQALVFGCTISVSFALLCLIVYELFAPTVTGLFIDDALTVSYSSRFMRLVTVATPMMALCYPLIVEFQAMGRVKESMICSILRKGVLDIPLLFLMNTVWPLYGCLTVQPIVDTIGLIAAVHFYRNICRKQHM